MNEEQLINKVKQNPNLKAEKRKKKKRGLMGLRYVRRTKPEEVSLTLGIAFALAVPDNSE